MTQVIPGFANQRWSAIDGIEVRRLGSQKLFRTFPRLGGLFYLLGATLHAYRQSPKVVISLQLGSSTLAGSIVSRLRNVDHIIRLTGGGTSQYKSEPFARRASVFGRFMLRLISRRQTTLVAPAKHLLEDFWECVPAFAGRTTQIINGVDVCDVARVEKNRQVVWYSRRGSEKSYELFKTVAELLPSVNFVIIGHFDEGSVPRNVKILGWQDRPERVLAASRVLLNTSSSEGMPNTVLQALACGSRVVGLANEGMREVRSMFPDSVDLVSETKAQTLADSLLRALDNAQTVEEDVPTTSTVFQSWSDVIRGGSE